MVAEGVGVRSVSAAQEAALSQTGSLHFLVTCRVHPIT
ncbi:hypothetical protein CCC_01933 [Paramagnetospirillum magnetotacticum MS-1]|uniref:Uncharacterized protein n=1 Tax=Paramagnetospirillum magnetotacticum MS-1 TaxID=272627 RepID=A0A0C2YPU4_PARME|nr:hypothetical protein CCC_01933 [Paramagnetospirillum magnetotacticum MS-1]